MFEIAVCLLSLGALGIHAGVVSTATLVLIGWSLCLVVIFVRRTIFGVMAGLFLGGAFVLGGLFVHSYEVREGTLLPGEQTVAGTARSVDRRLARSVVTVRESVSGELVQFFVRGQQSLLPGDTGVFHGTLELPQSFATDTGRVFDYPQYLESKGVVLVGYDPEVRSIERGRGSLARSATEARFAIADILARWIRFPADGVIAGMIVGYQGALPQSVKDLFRDTGVLHVLVLSGYNIMLLAGALAFLLRALPFRVRTIVSLVAIALLVLVSGAGIASVRAGIMGSIALLAGLSIRTYRPFRALLIAYLVFFAISPGIIFYDPGFHLSFLATTYMVFVFPRLLSYIKLPRHPFVKSAVEGILLACTIPLFMLPYTMYFSGMLPSATIIANIVLALCIPFFMGSGIALVVLSWSAPIASLIGAIVSWGGALVLQFLTWCARMPMWETPMLSGWIVLGVYTAFFFVLFQKDIKLFFLHLREKFE